MFPALAGREGRGRSGPLVHRWTGTPPLVPLVENSESLSGVGPVVRVSQAGTWWTPPLVHLVENSESLSGFLALLPAAGMHHRTQRARQRQGRTAMRARKCSSHVVILRQRDRGQR